MEVLHEHDGAVVLASGHVMGLVEERFDIARRDFLTLVDDLEQKSLVFRLGRHVNDIEGLAREFLQLFLVRSGEAQRGSVDGIGGTEGRDVDPLVTCDVDELLVRGHVLGDHPLRQRAHVGDERSAGKLPMLISDSCARCR
jgi:hypothetical protein